MHILHNKHNANLLNTLPNHTPIVNIDLLDGNGNVAGIDAKNAPNKLFVKIDNNILNQGLKPRVLEFYILLTYLIISYPKDRLSILKIQSLIIKYTNKKINKNTINTYLKTLIKKGLLYRSSIYLVAPRVGSDVDCSNYSIEHYDSNHYQAPKTRFTPFYILAYNHDTAPCELVLELYFASKPYMWHRPSLVCKELNICRKTYYKLLRELITKNIITKTKESYKKNLYENTNRLRLKEESTDIQDHRYYEVGDVWYEKRKLRKEKLARGEIQKTAHSRSWYASKMGPIMNEFGINYIPMFDDYDPDDAFRIVMELKEQYRRIAKPINAPMVVTALKKGYNWTKIKDRDHAKLKREEAKKEVFTWIHR